jgi:hypothetical protein
MPDPQKPITVTISGHFTTDELATMIGFFRVVLDRDSRHWDLMIDDPGNTVAEAEAMLRTWFPTHRVTVHQRQ